MFAYRETTGLECCRSLWTNAHRRHQLTSTTGAKSIVCYCHISYHCCRTKPITIANAGVAVFVVSCWQSMPCARLSSAANHTMLWRLANSAANSLLTSASPGAGVRVPARLGVSPRRFCSSSSWIQDRRMNIQLRKGAMRGATASPGQAANGGPPGQHPARGPARLPRCSGAKYTKAHLPRRAGRLGPRADAALLVASVGGSCAANTTAANSCDAAVIALVQLPAPHIYSPTALERQANELFPLACQWCNQ